ncbi:hypothetical protein [Minwuia sp.]|uniref:hypothetical protein n=1 Tax=Minwuia sp. TaxID=2493630 RepID=UPI003A91A030
MADVIPLRGVNAKTTPVIDIWRVGRLHHVQLQNVIAQVGLPAENVVIDASAALEQKNLIQDIRNLGGRLILDTNVAEISSVGKVSKRLRNAPWAPEVGVLSVSTMSASDRTALVDAIAEYAVEHGYQRVIAPSHVLKGGLNTPVFDLDRALCGELRTALDRIGGSYVAVDYCLILQHTVLKVSEEREAIKLGLKNIPFDNLWIRAAGFGSDATPAAIQNFIWNLLLLHSLRRGMIADYVDGLAAESAMYFGAVSAVSRGLVASGRFDVGSWDKVPKNRSPQDSGPPVRIPVFGIDGTLTRQEFQLIGSNPRLRRLVSCGRDCCASGFSDMEQAPKIHAVRSRRLQIDEINSVPDLHRPSHFLSQRMSRSKSLAIQIAKIDSGSEKLDRKFAKAAKRITEAERSLQELEVRVTKDFGRSRAFYADRFAGVKLGRSEK